MMNKDEINYAKDSSLEKAQLIIKKLNTEVSNIPFTKIISVRKQLNSSWDMKNLSKI